MRADDSGYGAKRHGESVELTNEPQPAPFRLLPELSQGAGTKRGKGAVNPATGATSPDVAAPTFKETRMLVLSRKSGEVLNIGECQVTILKVRDNGTVRVGVTAPRRTPIHRAEVAEQIARDEGEPCWTAFDPMPVMIPVA